MDNSAGEHAGNVVQINISDIAPATNIGFQIEQITNPQLLVCLVRRKIVAEYMRNAIGLFAAAGNHSPGSLEAAVDNDNVFTGTMHAPDIGVPAGFYGDVVIAGAEVAIFNDNIFGAFGITSVRISRRAFCGYVIDDHIRTEQWVNLPKI